MRPLGSRRAIAALVVLVAAGVLLAAGLSVRRHAPDRAAEVLGDAASSAGQPLQAAPDFDILLYQGGPAIGGSRVRLSQLWQRGEPVVVNFWAGLCPPCRAEMPDFQNLYDETAQGRFILIGVDVGPFIGLGTRGDGLALLRELGISFPAGVASDAGVVTAYRILGIPTTVFITSDGEILRKHIGLLTRGQMDAFVTELLRAPDTQ